MKRSLELDFRRYERKQLAPTNNEVPIPEKIETLLSHFSLSLTRSRGEKSGQKYKTVHVRNFRSHPGHSSGEAKKAKRSRGSRAKPNDFFILTPFSVLITSKGSGQPAENQFPFRSYGRITGIPIFSRIFLGASLSRTWDGFAFGGLMPNVP